MARSTTGMHSSVDTALVSESENVHSAGNVATASPKSIHSMATEGRTPKSAVNPSSPAATPSSVFTTLSSPASVQSHSRRRAWSEREEERLLYGVEKHGTGAWATILKDEECAFENRRSGELRSKYREMRKRSESNEASDMETVVSTTCTSASVNGAEETVFDIRTANAQVTEVFIGHDWSRAQWMAAEAIQPETRRNALLGDFERRIANKHKLISRISPARTPSRFISALALGDGEATLTSTGKKRRTRVALSEPDEDEQENDDPAAINTPLKKSKTAGTRLAPASSPRASIRSSPSVVSSKSGRGEKVAEAMLVHSDYSSDEGDVVYPAESAAEPARPASLASRCIIM